MVDIVVTDSFPASHRIRIDASGTLEPIHEHHWRARVWLGIGDELDADSAAQRARHLLARWTARYRGRSLNRVAPFDTVNPTAEEVARALATTFQRELPEARLRRVEIGEAEGFSATYWPAGADDDQSGS